MDRPSWLLNIGSDEYHAATKRNEYITSHRLALFRKCPALYKKTIDGKIVEGDTAAFALGRATHTLILEGAAKYTAEYVTSDGPVNIHTGKPYGKQTVAYANWLAAQTKPVISTADFSMMQNMREAVHAHAVAADLLSFGFTEGTIRTEWSGVPVQCRIDWFDAERNLIVDLKTCNDVDRFGYDIRDFGYVFQMAFYAKCVSLARGEKIDVWPQIPRCYLIAAEKKEPFRVSVTEICAATLDGAIYNHMGGLDWRDDASAMLAELKQCRQANVWPTRFEKVIYI